MLRELANKHRVLRREQRWSQAEMAERSGVSLGSLKRFESTGHISLISLLKLANTLGRLPDFEPVLDGNRTKDLNSLFSKSS